MRKFKKMLLGMALAMGVFAGSVGSCYAATGSIMLDLTVSSIYSKYVYAGKDINSSCLCVIKKEALTGLYDREKQVIHNLGMLRKLL